jgi:hypothetical protein
LLYTPIFSTYFIKKLIFLPYTPYFFINFAQKTNK